MTTITNNQAAWQTAAKTRPLKVGPGPNPDPAENEVVIKVAYAAVNSCDWNMQASPYFEMGYPCIWGADVAGTIVQLGVKVTRFKLGQRVIGTCDGLITRKVANSGFQLYSTSNAAVLPLSISTAASALFIDHKPPFPTLNPKPTGKTLLIRGGSSSCGSSAIQLATAAGCSVATTASRANSEYVRGLGASHVCDHKNPKMVDELSEILKPGDLVFDCIGTKETQVACGEILGKIGGGKLPILSPPQVPFPDNVEANFVNGLNPGLVNVGVGDAALAVGKFQAKPDPLLVEGGLEKAQEGMDLLKKGVSAKKVVIEISKE